MTTAGTAMEQRREQRQGVSLRATLRHYRDSMDVKLLDLSRSGAMASTEHPPARGEEVVLVRGSLQVVATIAWVRDEHFGLSFHKPVERRALINAA